MRILFVDQYAQPGGAQMCLREVIEAARARGWETRLMVPGAGLPRSIATYRSGPKSARDAAVFGADTVQAALALRRAVREHRIDLIYANGPRVLPAAALAGRPLIFHVHSYLARRSECAIVELALRSARARVLAASRFVAEPLIRMRSCAGVQVIYNGIAEQTFAPRSFRSTSLTVGIAGRIAPEKGQIDFVLAARRIAARHPETRFVICGAPLFSGGEYEQEVRRASAGLKMEFRGWTEHLAKTLHEIDILAVPSAPVDSLPRVIPEALSAGTPVAAYPSGGIPELMRSRRTCLLTERGDAGALADSIGELIADRNLLRRLAVNGRIEWERRFQLERFQREICDALAQFVHETGESSEFPDKACAASRERPRAAKVMGRPAG